MITYMDTLDVAMAQPVYLAGVNGLPGDQDITGRVADLDYRYDVITVQWDHDTANTTRYDSAQFLNTTDRDGHAWLILDLPPFHVG